MKPYPCLLFQEATWSLIFWLQLKQRATAKATTAIRIMPAAAGVLSRQQLRALKQVGQKHVVVSFSLKAERISFLLIFFFYL